MEKSNKSAAVGCAIRYIITALLTFFIYLSVTVVFVGLFYQNVGYTVYKIENEKSVELYRYFYSEGEDTKFAEYEQQGLELQKVETPAQLSGTPKVVADVITQTAGLVIVFAFVYASLWKMGASDSNLEAVGTIVADRWRGLKIGLLANIPLYIAFIIFVVARIGIIPGSWYALFRFINFPVFSLINALYGQATSTAVGIGWGRVAAGMLTFLTLPLFAQISYTLGFNRINISEKIIYKSNKK